MYDRLYVKKHRRRRIAAVATLIGAVGVTSLVIVSMLGRFTGTFTVSLKNSEVKLSLYSLKSDIEEEKAGTSYIRIDDVPLFEEWSYEKFNDDFDGNMDEALDSEKYLDYKDIPGNNHPSDKAGEKGSVDYFKYTFYVRNTGTKTAQYNLSLKYEESGKPHSGADISLDDTLRVMLYENDLNSDEHNKAVYAKASGDARRIRYIDENGEERYMTTDLEFLSKHPAYYVDEADMNEYPLVDASFIDNSTLLKLSTKGFAMNDVKRYTLVMWLEGEDLQSNNSIASPVGAGLKIGIEINAYTAYNDHENEE